LPFQPSEPTSSQAVPYIQSCHQTFPAPFYVPDVQGVHANTFNRQHIASQTKDTTPGVSQELFDIEPEIEELLKSFLDETLNSAEQILLERAQTSSLERQEDMTRM
jgi:hypothetical protein